MSHFRWLAAGVLLALSAGAAPLLGAEGAQPPDAPPAPGAPAAPAAAPVSDPAAAALRAEVVKAYQELKTYAAGSDYSLLQKQGRWTDVQGSDQRAASDRAAGKIIIDRPEFLLVSDGTTLRVKSEQFPGRYLEVPAPKPLTLESLAKVFPPLGGPVQPELALLLADDPIATMAGDPKVAVTLVKPAPAPGGAAGPALMFKNSEGGTWKLYVDPTSHLVTKAVQEFDLAAMGGAPGAAGDSASITYNIKIEKANQPLDPTTFAFDAGKSKPVNSLRALVQPDPGEAAPAPGTAPGTAPGAAPGAAANAKPGEPPDPAALPAALEGKPAPSAKVQNLQGQDVDLGALKTGIVILDFDGTWGASCQTWLPKLQALHEWAVAGRKPVAIYVVDVREKPEKIKDYWAKARLTLPVLLDADGSAGEVYKVGLLPHTVLIQAGKVVKVYAGPTPDLEGTLKAQIDELSKK